jgi:hypothetical protein
VQVIDVYLGTKGFGHEHERVVNIHTGALGQKPMLAGEPFWPRVWRLSGHSTFITHIDWR